ncbi:MAG: STAS/SEC14 domain-containing protein [Shewanella sp.]
MRLTRSVTIMMLRAKLQDHATIRLWYEFSSEFEGISVAAIWDDAILGLFHLSDFSRVVMIVNTTQTSAMVNALACMLPRPVKVFSAHEQTAAKAWLDQ